MKNKILGMLAIVVSILFVPHVLAACTDDATNAKMRIDRAADESVLYCTGLSEAFTNAQEGDTVTLLDNATVSSYVSVIPNAEISFTFDLNGKTLSNGTEATLPILVIDKENVTMTIVDTGKTGTIIQNAITTGVLVQKGTLILEGGTYIRNNETKAFPVVQTGVNGGSSDTQYDNTAKLVVKDGATIKGYYGVSADGVGATIDIQGGTIDVKGFAVSGNGATTKNSTITISGGTMTSSDSAAIYQPQLGTLNITGGDITGVFGIVARQGEILIKEDANITANGDSSKTYRVGDAKADGEYVMLNGGVGVIVDNTETSYPNDAKVIIEGGNFDTTNKSIVTYQDDTNEDKDVIVSGGSFNQTIATQYLVEDVEQSEGGVVGKIYQITTEKVENGTVTVNKNAAVGETVKITYVANKGYKLNKITVTYEKDGKTTEVKVADDGTFVMPEGNVKVNVTFVKVEVLATDKPTEDVKPDEAPATYDNVLGYVVLAFGALGTAIVSKKVLNK